MHINEQDRLIITLYKNRAGGWIWPVDQGLPAPRLEDNSNALVLSDEVVLRFAFSMLVDDILSRRPLALRTLALPCSSSKWVSLQRVTAWGHVYSMRAPAGHTGVSPRSLVHLEGVLRPVSATWNSRETLRIVGVQAVPLHHSLTDCHRNCLSQKWTKCEKQGGSSLRVCLDAEK